MEKSNEEKSTGHQTDAKRDEASKTTKDENQTPVIQDLASI